jgi:ADP-ribose pyrophosphatase YjhB (NUDIX family)
MPIISIGIIAFRYDEKINDFRFLMICRKDTLGFMDFMRGKYSIYNKEYIINLLKEMTIIEKERLMEKDFDNIWNELWCCNPISTQYKTEENLSREKFNALTSGIMTQNDAYTLVELINISNKETNWTEAEWGFPKGRRNHNENDMTCAIREFVEETGYSQKHLYNIDNIQPFEEIFMGSNYKSYKHKYYLMKMEKNIQDIKQFDKMEVSKLEWKTYKECVDCIRPYNLEKKKLIQNVYNCLIGCKLA